MVQTAAELFIKQGYAATSVRQIAEAVGCTEAALYYHFTGGKRALLQAVVETKTPDFTAVVEDCEQAGSLCQLIHQFGQRMLENCEQRERLIQWVISEYPHLNAEERAIFHEKHLKFHALLAQRVAHFTEDEQAAQDVAWMILCAMFGYRQLFITLGLADFAGFSPATFIEKLAYHLAE